MCGASDALGTSQVQDQELPGLRRPKAKPDMEVLLRLASSVAQT